MIARITEVRKNSTEQITLVANFYETRKEIGSNQVMYTVDRKSIEKAITALGIEENGLLEIDIDKDANSVYLLLKLCAHCDLGPNAQLPCKEIRGVILELNGRSNLHIETNYADRYVICRCDPRIVRRYHQIFLRDNLTEIPGFYYHQTGEAYIGYHIK